MHSTWITGARCEVWAACREATHTHRRRVGRRGSSAMALGPVQYLGFTVFGTPGGGGLTEDSPSTPDAQGVVQIAETLNAKVGGKALFVGTLKPYCERPDKVIIKAIDAYAAGFLSTDKGAAIFGDLVSCSPHTTYVLRSLDDRASSTLTGPRSREGGGAQRRRWFGVSARHGP